MTRKERVWARDKVCHYCGKVPKTDFERTVDHVWPVSLGGRNAMFNVVAACKMCNLRKGNKVSTCDCPFCQATIKHHRKKGYSEDRVVRHPRQRRADARRANKRLGVRYDPVTGEWGYYTEQHLAWPIEDD